MSLPEEERQKQVALLQSVGLISPDDNGFFGEMSDRFNQAFYSGMRGIGSTIDELGFGDALEQHFDKILRTNRQWDAPEDVGVAGYVGGALGSAAGSSAVTLGATAAGGLLGGPKGALIAGGAATFAQTFGDNVKRNREAGYSEDRALGMAFLESGVDSLIENAPWGVVGKAGKMAATAGRLRKISAAGKKELLNKIGQRMSAQIGKEQTKNLLFQWGKQATLTGLGESGEEGLQYINSFVNQKLGGDPNAKFSINELADAMAQGFIGGFGLGGIQSIPGIRHEAQMRAGKPELSDEAVPLQERNYLDRLIVDIGNDLGIKIDFMDSRQDKEAQEKISNGFYDKSNKTLYLNRNTYTVDPMETLGHELKHYIDDNMPELSKTFNELLEAGKNEAGKVRPSEIAQMFKYSAEKGNNEFSADMFGKLFARPETWSTTAASLESKTPGMGEKFLKTVQEFLAMIKARLVGTPEAETYLNNVTELEAEVGKILGELRRRNGNSSQVENVIGVKGNTDVESVPVSQINVDAQRFQFKSNTNKTSGVDESNKLGGDWDPRTAGNLYLWEDKNGNLYVVNGHHRFELAQRNGVENINAIIDRETDGVTAEQARRNGVLINIRDGQGDVRDYASFVRSENLSEQEAEAQGVTARKKGRAGFLLGKAGDTLYEAYINEVIPESKAVIIAEVANGNEAVEYAGIKLASDRKLAGETLRQTLKLAAQNTTGKKAEAEQGGLFDMVDDSVLQEWETIGKIAAKHIKEIRTRIEAAKDAIKNPEAAKSLGVKTTKGAEKLLVQAQEELARWENYATDPELMAQLREEAGIAPQEVVSETENTTAPEVASAENAQTTPTDEDAAGLFEAQEETVSEKEAVATPKENLEVAEEESEVKQTAFEKLKDRSAEIGFSFDKFYEDFAPQLEAILTKARRAFGDNLGNGIEEDWRDAAYEAMANAYMAFSPETGNKISTLASTAIRNAIASVNRKHKSNFEATGGSISLNQTNDQGKELGDVVQVEDTNTGAGIDENYLHKLREWRKTLSKKDRLILALMQAEEAPSVIGRSFVGMSTEEVYARLKKLKEDFKDFTGYEFSRKWGRENEKRAYYDIPWAEGMQRAVTDKSFREPVFVSETPEAFKKIGFASLPMLMNVRHLRLNYYDRADFEKIFGTMRHGEHTHNLRDKLKNLPEALKHPLAIVVNKTPNATPGSVVAITDMDVNGKKVVVPVLIESVKTINNNDIDSHLVLTVYDSNNWMEQFLTPAIKAEKNGVGIFYFDANKASRYTAYSKEIGNIPTGFVHNIAEAGINVKPQTETLQFKNWFADSKVVDENGDPLVVYHGTNADDDFTVFDIWGSNHGLFGIGAYFTDSKDVAQGYTSKGKGKNPRIYQVYLSIKNPLDMDADFDRKLWIEQANTFDVDSSYFNGVKTNEDAFRALQEYCQDEQFYKYEANEFIVDFIKGMGFDGITHIGGGRFNPQSNVRHRVYIAFDPEQIKSATDNIGTFDPENPDINYSRKILHQQINPIIRDGKVRDEYADLLENKEYTPETIEKWQNQAFDWIERQGGVAPAAEALINDKAPSDGHVAELARRLVLNSDVFVNHVDKADRVKLYELEIDARSAWGRAGRAMQLNALNLQDVASVQALLNKLHKDMPNADLLKLRNQIKKELDVDIFELDDKIVKDKEKLDAVLRAHLAKKAQWHDKLYEYWINAILSGPGTHASNLLGNTANMAYELGIKRFTEALVNVAMGRKDGATFGEFREMLKAFNWRNAAKAFVQAKNIEVLDPSGKFLESQGVAIGGKTGRFIRTPGRLLKAADAFAKALIQPMETAAYAYRMGVQKGLSGAKLQAYIQQQLTDKDSAAYEWAAERAKELTFQEDPGSAVKALMHLRETKGPAGVALKLMLPFLKTPANILRQGVRKSPLGAINLAYETGKILTGKGEFDGKYVSRVAEQLLAWGAVMALAGMGDDDELPIITGSTAPYGSAEYNYKAKNIPPYSIRIGDSYYSYQRIEPLATGLAAIADGIQAMRDARNGKDGSAVMKELLFNGIKIAGEKSYLDSIGEMLKLVEDPERHGMRPATNLLASSVPKLVTQISQAMSENVGDSKSRNKGLEWWKDQFHIVTNRAGVTVPIPKIDFFGREVKKDDFGDTLFSPIGRLLPVKRFEADNMDPAERLIWNYNRKNPNSEYYPPLLRNTFTVNKEKLYFAGKDYHDYAVEAGKLAHRQINNAIRAGVINVNNPKESDIEVIKKIFTRARKETQNKFIKRAKKEK